MSDAASAEARAVIVTAPDDALGDDEVAAIEDFRDDGGAVTLASAGAGADDAADARDNLDALAADLGSDLRTGEAVTDGENNLGGEENPTTTNFDTDFDLFGAYGDGDDGGSGGSLAFDDILANPEGSDVPGEYVRFVNDGDAPLDLDGYEVYDAVDNGYAFGAVTVDPGATITLYTGSGSDTDSEVYWGRGGGSGTTAATRCSSTIRTGTPSSSTTTERGRFGATPDANRGRFLDAEDQKLMRAHSSARIERRTSNPTVVGSNPTVPAICEQSER